jgi:hypothetical protein
LAAQNPFMADLRPVHNSIRVGRRRRGPHTAVNCLSKKAFSVYAEPDKSPTAIMNEAAMRGLRTSLRPTLAVLAIGMLAGGLNDGAIAQSAQQKTAPKAAPAKPAAKSAAPARDAKQAAPPSAATGGAEPTLVGQFGTWGAYTATPNGRKVCFALAKPSSSKTNPPNRPRDPAYAFISTRPAEKVANEVSIMIGYTLKPGSEGSVEIGGARYAMYTQGDGLWIKNAAEEDRLVEALRKGADATVKGVSAKGTETTDVFPLKGLAQALDRVAQECRR